MDGLKVDVEGILNIDKPFGVTSMDVVRRLKRASGQKRVGHAGTLDPVATGVIPICFGQATRLMEYLVDGTKDYRTVIELGADTDTFDAFGRVTGGNDPSHVTFNDIDRSLECFKGMIHQVPPMYSALKIGGKRLYALARAGIEVEREPRKVEVFSIKLLDWSPPLATLEVSCGRGFYVRSLAHDIGQSLGCGGHLKSLVRLRSGPLQVSDTISPSEAERRFANGTWREALHAPDFVLYDLRAIIVGRRLEGMIAHGQPLPKDLRMPVSKPSERCRVYTTDGRFLAIIAFDAFTGQWRPDKVFSLNYSESGS